MKFIPKPEPGEYDPYAIMYIKLLPDDGMILQHLFNNRQMIDKFLMSLTPEQWMYRYAEGKWTIKEILLHMIDDERVYAYRALRIARGDTTPLPGFDQDPYVVTSRANERSVESLLEEYASVRNATLTLLGNLPDDAWTRRGTANDHTVTVRALVYHLAGHELHHINIIKDRYLSVS
ncbi:MAG: DinB family protein [Bacteriovoracaceae bacterium]